MPASVNFQGYFFQCPFPGPHKYEIVKCGVLLILAFGFVSEYTFSENKMYI